MGSNSRARTPFDGKVEQTDTHGHHDHLTGLEVDRPVLAQS
jgi:hypothetical protein